MTAKRRGRLPLLLAVALAIVACDSAATDSATAPSPPSTTTVPGTAITAVESTMPPTVTTALPEPKLGVSGLVEWEFVGLVIQEPDREPVLCPWYVQASLPPGCLGIPIAGLDWSQIPWAERSEDAPGWAWTTMRITGTFDGERFELTRQPEPPPEVFEETAVETFVPCEEPPDGWQVVNPAKVDFESRVGAAEYAQAQPDFLGTWNHRLPDDAAVDSVKVFTFTGNLDEHEARLRDIYGGALCVGLAPRSLAELEQIRAEIKDILIGPAAQTAGIYTFQSEVGNTIDVVHAKVVVFVLAAEVGAQGWLDWQFGEGVVNLHSQLQRIGGSG